MKLLLWACIVCVAFAQKDYNDYHRYPLHPSLNRPYNPPTNSFPSPYYPSQNNAPKYSDFYKPTMQVPNYPWVLTVPGAPVTYPIPDFPTATRLTPPPPPPPPLPRVGPPRFVFPSSNSEVSAAPAARPAIAKPAESERLVTEPAGPTPTAATSPTPELRPCDSLNKVQN
ncbi:proline-rich protein 27 [Echinops telfairi]|uniref:Proline-rich protein 27 n=1 Tax=Echinops telfairi TaxID=9371 RepID=A0ABM0IMF0_ECHTE|nr:proline-rich protein 27 [Echinops telfairi]